MILYKLTDKDGYTRKGKYGETLWAEGLIVESKKPGTKLCSDQVIHAYIDPRLAILINPIHADIQDPILWECSGDVVASDELKVGVKSLTCIRQIEPPVYTVEQIVKFAILCSLKTHRSPAYTYWANKWLDGTDRSLSSINLIEKLETTHAIRSAMWATYLTMEQQELLITQWHVRAVKEYAALSAAQARLSADLLISIAESL